MEGQGCPYRMDYTYGRLASLYVPKGNGLPTTHKITRFIGTEHRIIEFCGTNQFLAGNAETAGYNPFDTIDMYRMDRTRSARAIQFPMAG